MRAGLWGAALVALAACTPPSAPAPEATTTTAAASAAGEEAVDCITWLALQSTAIAAGNAQGDAAVLDAAQAKWRTRAQTSFTPDELAQYFASNVAVLDDAPAAEIAANAERCRTSAPQ